MKKQRPTVEFKPRIQRESFEAGRGNEE